MTARCLAVTVTAIFLGSGIGARGGKKDDKENLNPYRTVKVGDFAVYKKEGKDSGYTMKKAVIAKDDKSVKLRITRGESKPTELTIDITKPDDIPIYHPNLPHLPPSIGKFVKTDEGTEKIKVAGREYDGSWRAGKYIVKTPTGRELTSEIKVWFSKDAPLDGLLRIEVKDGSVMELIESGSMK